MGRHKCTMAFRHPFGRLLDISWQMSSGTDSKFCGKLSPFLIRSVLSYLYKQPGDKHWSPGVPTARGLPHWCQNTTYTDSENWQKQSLLLFRFLNQINNWVILNQTDNEEIWDFSFYWESKHCKPSVDKWCVNVSHLRLRPFSTDGWLLWCWLHLIEGRLELDMV